MLQFTKINLQPKLYKENILVIEINFFKDLIQCFGKNSTAKKSFKPQLKNPKPKYQSKKI